MGFSCCAKWITYGYEEQERLSKVPHGVSRLLEASTMCAPLYDGMVKANPISFWFNTFLVCALSFFINIQIVFIQLDYLPGCQKLWVDIHPSIHHISLLILCGIVGSSHCWHVEEKNNQTHTLSVLPKNSHRHGTALKIIIGYSSCFMFLFHIQLMLWLMQSSFTISYFYSPR